MHELSIAVSILDLIHDQADRIGGQHVQVVHLKLGPLSGVVKESLLRAFEQAIDHADMTGCQLVIEEVPLTAFCPVCGQVRAIPSVQYLCCPVCDSPTPDVVSGREMEVVAMEVST
jgi:hydrogenase nickel incorporation protein HypA/HybF